MRINDLLYSPTTGARIVRTLLRPAASLYGAGVEIRNRLYDSGRLPIQKTGIPVISVGNISAGGTGKTPFTAWLASRLQLAGATPAIILRGYGDDEPLVHQRLNPDISVVIDPDRVRGVGAAEADGASIALLDDGFQHRRIARDADIVLVSAERWRDAAGLLPAGELREPTGALSRATVIVVTRKSASREMALGVEKALRSRFPRTATVIAFLQPAYLRDSSGNELHLSVLNDVSVFAISAVGDNDAFAAQLGALDANVTARSFRDHHQFSARDVAQLAMESAGARYVVCTLKDAVKLWPHWPADARPLWYVSQALVLESGAGALEEMLARVTATQRK